MKLTIDKNILFEAISIIKGISDKKHVSPILSNVLILADNLPEANFQL